MIFIHIFKKIPNWNKIKSWNLKNWILIMFEVNLNRIKNIVFAKKNINLTMTMTIWLVNNFYFKFKFFFKKLKKYYFFYNMI